jgi:hypothetical protein
MSDPWLKDGDHFTVTDGKVVSVVRSGMGHEPTGQRDMTWEEFDAAVDDARAARAAGGARTGVPCPEADNVWGLVRRIERSNQALGEAMHKIALGGLTIEEAIAIARSFEASDV